MLGKGTGIPEKKCKVTPFRYKFAATPVAAVGWTVCPETSKASRIMLIKNVFPHPPKETQCQKDENPPRVQG